VVVLHVDDGFERVDDPVVDDRVHLQRDVVPGDGLLGRHAGYRDLHVDLGQPGGERVDPGQAGLANAGQGLPEAENDTLLVLADDPEAEHFGHPIPGTGCAGLTGPADGVGPTASVRSARGPGSIICRTMTPANWPAQAWWCPPACRSGDPAPAELGSLPAGDGLVLADDLDLPQVQAGVMHDLLSLGHPVTGRGLRDLVLRARLLHENQVGRAGVPGHITMRLHTPYDAGAL